MALEAFYIEDLRESRAFMDLPSDDHMFVIVITFGVKVVTVVLGYVVFVQFVSVAFVITVVLLDVVVTVVMSVLLLVVVPLDG